MDNKWVITNAICHHKKSIKRSFFKVRRAISWKNESVTSKLMTSLIQSRLWFGNTSFNTTEQKSTTQHDTLQHAHLLLLVDSSFYSLHDTVGNPLRSTSTVATTQILTISIRINRQSYIIPETEWSSRTCKIYQQDSCFIYWSPNISMLFISYIIKERIKSSYLSQWKNQNSPQYVVMAVAETDGRLPSRRYDRPWMGK